MAAPGTPWFKLYSQLREHPKIEDLADDLGIPKAHALGHIVCLWCWVCDYYPDGELGTIAARRIARAAEWNADPSIFVHGLVSVRLVDIDGDNLSIHDWLETAEGYKRAKAQRKKRKSAKSSTGTEAVQSQYSTGTVAVQYRQSTDRVPGKRRGEEKKILLRREKNGALHQKLLAKYNSVFGKRRSVMPDSTAKRIDKLVAAGASEESLLLAVEGLKLDPALREDGRPYDDLAQAFTARFEHLAEVAQQGLPAAKAPQRRLSFAEQREQKAFKQDIGEHEAALAVMQTEESG